MRFELLILITEFGLSCYHAARVLGLPYTNAKVIYRVYRAENRVSNASNKKENLQKLANIYPLQHAYIMRKSAFKKLVNALGNGSMTSGQRAQIYEHNFDLFISKPLL